LGGDGGTFHQEEFRDISTCLEGRLEALRLPIAKLNGLMGEGETGIPKRYNWNNF